MIDYSEDNPLKLLIRRQGSVAVPAFLHSLPSAVLSVIILYLDEWAPYFREDYGFLEVNRSQLWAVTTGLMFSLLMFRTKLAWSRFWEGTGLLHQMRGEWFDTVSNLITFSISAKASKPKEVDEFRHTVVRIMSLCHGNALEEISDGQFQMESLDTGGLSDNVLLFLNDADTKYHFNKVEVMLHLLQSLITDSYDKGILKIPPPILSRVYQTISRGFVNLLNAKKIQDTRFPFPFAQVITILLIIDTFLVPLMLASVLKSKILCAVMTGLPMWGCFCLLLISQQLENPFGVDDNDLPLQHFQTEMNNCLMMLLHPRTDIIAKIDSSRCEMNFQKLREAHTLTFDKTELSLDRPVPARMQTKRLSELCAQVSDVSQSNEAPGKSPVSGNTERQPADRQSLTWAPAVANQSNRDTTHSTSNFFASGTLEMEIAVNDVGVEPISAHRNIPRSEATLLATMRPKDIMPRDRPSQTMGDLGGSVRPKDIATGRDRASPTPSELAVSDAPLHALDLHPLLAKATTELVLSLQHWTRHVESQVEDLNSNSFALKKALQQFGESIPTLGASKESSSRHGCKAV
jgi:predicted membrane chloride channel (bestrophin family)